MEAWRAADRAREAVAAEPFSNVGELTISAGVCDLSEAADPSELFRLADGALYWAKQHGRDVTFLYSPEVVEVLSDAEHAERLTRLQALQSIRVLARAVDAKDPSTRQHSERVADLAQVLAQALGWPADDAAAVRDAGLVHDVGKIARAGRDPVQARPAHPRRVRAREGPRRAGRRDRGRRAVARPGGLGARPPRALGRAGLPGRDSPPRRFPRARASSRWPTPGTS